MEYKYYAVNRPVRHPKNGFPNKGLVRSEVYDKRTEKVDRNFHRMVWAEVVYNRQLTCEEMNEYEFVAVASDIEKITYDDFCGGIFEDFETVNVVITEDYEWFSIIVKSDVTIQCEKFNNAFYNKVLMFKPNDWFGTDVNDILLVVPAGTKGYIKRFKSEQKDTRDYYYFVPECYEDDTPRELFLDIENLEYFLTCVKYDPDLCKTCRFGCEYPDCTKAYSPRHDDDTVISCDGYSNMDTTLDK